LFHLLFVPASPVRQFSAGGAVHGTDSEAAAVGALFSILEQKARRLIYKGYPTGVEVCAAMQHGGPLPWAPLRSSAGYGRSATRTSGYQRDSGTICNFPSSCFIFRSPKSAFDHRLARTSHTTQMIASTSIAARLFLDQRAKRAVEGAFSIAAEVTKGRVLRASERREKSRFKDCSGGGVDLAAEAELHKKH